MEDLKREKNRNQGRWEAAKNCIRSAYERTPTHIIFIWRDLPLEIWLKPDVEILESIATYAEECSGVLMPDDSPVYVNSFLDDNFLRKGFAVNRELSKQVLRIQSQCCYCGVVEKCMDKWTVNKDMAIERDMPMQIFVCPSNNKCTEIAYSKGYRLDRFT